MILYCPKAVLCDNFNPRTPCGVRPVNNDVESEELKFQSTHPVRGATGVGGCGRERPAAFQSTHPVRGATHRNLKGVNKTWYFNPRTPCGVRRLCVRLVSGKGDFNPRTPCGVRRQTCTTWFAPIFATLPNQMYVCLHYTCFTTLFQPKTWFSAVFQRCEAPRESMSAPASHRVKASATPPAHRSAWRRYAQRGSDSYSQDCKSAGCPSPG